MVSRSIILRRCLFNVIASLATLPIHQANADVIMRAGTHYSGHIVGATDTTILIEVACDRNQVAALDKATIDSVEFDSECVHKSAKPAAVVTPSCSAPVHGFEATVVGLSERPFIKNFELRGSTTAFLRYHDDSTLVTEQSRIRRISAVTRCTAVPTVSQVPGEIAPGICYEPLAWAVAFTGRPVSRNQIFTQGFSIYVAGDDKTGGSGPDVREAFGHALTLWTSALERIKDELAPELKEFLDRSVSRSATGGYTLLTPPQAVRRYCRETATFEVRWVTTRGLAFPNSEQQVLAKAQFQGRTVFVNAIDYSYSLDLKAVLGQDGTHSLVSIMAHELGHAFGLGHDDEGAESVMRSTASVMSRSPTDEDARRLARVLLQDVKGRGPGDVSFLGCEGLRAR